jgi:hypothetical protein
VLHALCAHPLGGQQLGGFKVSIKSVTYHYYRYSLIVRRIMVEAIEDFAAGMSSSSSCLSVS